MTDVTAGTASDDVTVKQFQKFQGFQGFQGRRERCAPDGRGTIGAHRVSGPVKQDHGHRIHN